MLIYLEDGNALASLPPAVDGDCCDNCVRAAQRDPVKVDLAKELCMVLEVQHRFSGPRGSPDIHLICEVLVGSKAKAVQSTLQSFSFLQELSGIGKGRSAKWYHDFILGPVLDEGMLQPVQSEPGVLVPTDKGTAFRMQSLPFDVKAPDARGQAFSVLENIGMRRSDGKKARQAARKTQAMADVRTAVLIVRETAARAARCGDFDYCPERAIDLAIKVAFDTRNERKTPAPQQLMASLQSAYFDTHSDERVLFAAQIIASFEVRGACLCVQMYAYIQYAFLFVHYCM